MQQAIMTSNTNEQAVLATGTALNFGTTVHRYGCALKNNGTNITAKCGGLVNMDVSIVAEPTAAGTMTAMAYRNGVAIPGATATGTAGDTSTQLCLSFPALVSGIQCRCADAAVITVVVSGAAGTVNSVTAVVSQ